MRSFQLILLFLFIILDILGGVGTYFNLKGLFQNKIKFKISYWAYSILLILFFIFLYIYPNQPRNATNYLVYFYFNAIIFIDLILKITLSLFYIFGLFLKKKKIVSIAGIIISAGLGMVMLYGLFFGKNELKANYIDLSYQALPQNFDNYKIVQISDTHLGSMLKSNKLLYRVEKKIKEIHPDLILFTGDLVNNFSYEAKGWDKVFDQLNSEGKSYAILGNHDYGNYTTWKNKANKQNNFEGIIQAYSDFGFKLLRNENAVIHNGKDSIFIVGVEDWGLPPFPQYANLNKANEGIPEGAFKILMTHDPAHWENVVRKRGDFQLTLSGHTHGMQWGIKLAGIPYSLAYLTRITWGGLYQDKDTYLYVNTGLGTVGVPWRIDMSPEITVITLKRTKIN